MFQASRVAGFGLFLGPVVPCLSQGAYCWRGYNDGAAAGFARAGMSMLRESDDKSSHSKGRRDFATRGGQKDDTIMANEQVIAIDDANFLVWYNLRPLS